MSACFAAQVLSWAGHSADVRADQGHGSDRSVHLNAALCCNCLRGEDGAFALRSAGRLLGRPRGRRVPYIQVKHCLPLPLLLRLLLRRRLLLLQLPQLLRCWVPPPHPSSAVHERPWACRPLVLPEMNANMQFGHGSLVKALSFHYLFAVPSLPFHTLSFNHGRSPARTGRLGPTRISCSWCESHCLSGGLPPPFLL